MRNNLTLANLAQAQYLLDVGDDPRPFVEQALQGVEQALRIKADFGPSHLFQAQAHLLAARHELRARRNPSAALTAGRLALKNAYQHSHRWASCWITGAKLEQVAAEWEERQGRTRLPLLQQARELARHAVQLQPSVEAHQELARVSWRLAQALPPGQARAAIAEGLARLDLALKLDSEVAHVHAIRGGLLLAQARMAHAVTERLEPLRQAQASFARATGLNPLLRREYEEPLREAEALR